METTDNPQKSKLKLGNRDRRSCRRVSSSNVKRPPKSDSSHLPRSFNALTRKARVRSFRSAILLLHCRRLLQEARGTPAPASGKSDLESFCDMLSFYTINLAVIAGKHEGCGGRMRDWLGSPKPSCTISFEPGHMKLCQQ